MLRWALIFLVIGVILSVLGFGGAAGTAYLIARWLAIVALALFVVFLILGVVAANRMSDRV